MGVGGWRSSGRSQMSISVPGCRGRKTEEVRSDQTTQIITANHHAPTHTTLTHTRPRHVLQAVPAAAHKPPLVDTPYGASPASHPPGCRCPRPGSWPCRFQRWCPLRSRVGGAGRQVSRDDKEMPERVPTAQGGRAEGVGRGKGRPASRRLHKHTRHAPRRSGKIPQQSIPNACGHTLPPPPDQIP